RASWASDLQWGWAAHLMLSPERSNARPNGCSAPDWNGYFAWDRNLNACGSDTCSRIRGSPGCLCASWSGSGSGDHSKPLLAMKSSPLHVGCLLTGLLDTLTALMVAFLTYRLTAFAGCRIERGSTSLCL